MKRVLLIGLLALSLGACNGMGDVDPILTACGICEMLDQSGICDVAEQLEAEKCEGDEVLVFTNLRQAFKEGVPIQTDCR